MAYLHITANGTERHKHSYSAGQMFDTSPSKYKLRYIDGWKEKDNKASFMFGRALEQAIQFHHENGGKGGFSEFTRLWAEHKDNTELTYTKVEGDWASLNRAGQEMMILYSIRLPSLPIPLETSVFQREIEKEVFPGHAELGGIIHAGKLDIIANVIPNHPLLPNPEHYKVGEGLFRKLIIDIKTSGLDFDERQGMCAFDSQLRNYSWLTGIRDVAFLWFKKAGHRLSKGRSVTLLTDSVKFKAGDEAVIAAVDDDKAYIVKNDTELEAMNTTQGRKADKNGKLGLDTTKAGEARKEIWLVENAELVDADMLTRQRLQFNAGIVKKQYADDAGAVVARQIVGIVNCWKNKSWPMTFGVRYPHDSRKDSYFRAFVEEDKMFRDQYFIKSATDNFDDLIVPDEDPDDGGLIDS